MKKYAFLLFMFFFVTTTQAQDNLFGAAIAGGFNAAQLHGDYAAGYNKIGLNTGLRAVINFAEKQEIGIGLLYDQRGSRNALSSGNSTIPFKVSLNYVAVPVTYTYKDWYQEEEDYYRVYFTGGLVYGRLINAEQRGGVIKNTCFDAIHTNDFSFTLGASYFFQKKWAAVFRFTRVIVPIAKAIEGDCVQEFPLEPFQLTFRVEYYL